mmetsp:Transcript_71294/g.133354  ORF Transcript_71294/g.133354 Transcript_71294/m.133354 type:complete len:276 (+) Transcript_71294:76-903(+)
MSQQLSARTSRPEKKAAREARRNSQTRRQRSHSSSHAHGGDKALLAEASEVMDVVRDDMAFPAGKVSTPKSGVQVKASPGAESCISTESPPSPLQLPASALDDSDTWPSLHAAVEDGWEFCSEGSADEDSWNMPEEALAEPVDEPDFLLLTTTGTPTLAPAAAPSQKPMFAEVLMQNLPPKTVRPPQSPKVGCQLREPRSARPKEVRAAEGEEDDSNTHYEDFSDLRAGKHGWHRKHKSSWSVKQSRKVAEKAGLRMYQSMKDKGLLDGDNEEEE